MLDIRELRIGNVVCDDDSFKTFNFIESIFCKDGDYAVTLKNKHYSLWLEHNGNPMVLGVPITEKWLIKLGFKDVTQSSWMDKSIKAFAIDDFDYTVELRNGIIEFGCEAQFVPQLPNPKYVHQLQNIYFDFTRKELDL